MGTSTEVLGRKTYALMEYWETYSDADGSADEHEFARRWRGIDKVVVSTTMAPEELDLRLDAHRTFDNGTTYLRCLPR